MIEELKLVLDMFKGATDTALYAFIAYGVYKLTSLSIVTFSILHGVKYIIPRLFVDEKNQED